MTPTPRTKLALLLLALAVAAVLATSASAQPVSQLPDARVLRKNVFSWVVTLPLADSSGTGSVVAYNISTGTLLRTEWQPTFSKNGRLLTAYYATTASLPPLIRLQYKAGSAVRYIQNLSVSNEAVISSAPYGYTYLSPLANLFVGDVVGMRDTLNALRASIVSGGGGGGTSSWSTLTGKPSTFTPSAHVHPISEVTGLTAALAAKLAQSDADALYKAIGYVPTWSEITGKPNLFSGSYTDLTSKPTIPTVPGVVSAFTNDAGYTTQSAGDARYPLLSGSYANPPWLTSLPYTKLTGTPTIPTNLNQLTNGPGYLVASDIAGKQATLTGVSDVPGLTTALAGKESTITTGSSAQYIRGDKTLATLNADVVPDGTTNKAYTATEKTKLSGVATGATNVALTNNLTTSTTGTGLDAAQGFMLKGLIDALTTTVGTKVSSTSGTSTFETLTTPTLASPVLTGTMTGAGAINTTGAITTTGNITRSGFQTTDSQLKVGLLEFQSHSSGNNWIGSNVYYNTNSFRYRTSTGGAVLFYFKSTEGQFRIAVAGTQDASLPNTGNNVQMKINADGTFAVGAPVSDTEGLYTGATFKVDPTGNTTQTGKANYPAINAASGVTGNVTNNSPSGLVRFAAGGTTLTVTNSFATTSSKIFVQVTGTDATAKTATITKAAGSFVITLNAAATAETAVDFFLIN